MFDIFFGITMPFLGTALGAACVFLAKDKLRPKTGRALKGFAAGVMVAACFWSLLIPALEESAHLDIWRFFPPLLGLWAGFGLMLLIERFMPEDKKEKGLSLLFLAVTMHNIPEGMAVGVVLAGLNAGENEISSAAALTLAAGIAIQNFPEGAIISLPMKGMGGTRRKAFLFGVLTGAAEPMAAAITLLLASAALPLIPYFLAFAAGAMFFVAARELLEQESTLCAICFGAGVSVMLIIEGMLG